MVSSKQTAARLVGRLPELKKHDTLPSKQQGFYWVYHKLEDTSTKKESSEEKRKWCKLVYISVWIKLHCSVLYIGWTEAGK